MVLLHIISLVFSSNLNIFKTNIPHVDAYLIMILMPLLIFGYETYELIAFLGLRIQEVYNSVPIDI